MSEPICLCPASSEYDPPCPKHGVLGIGVTGATREEEPAFILAAPAQKPWREMDDAEQVDATKARARELGFVIRDPRDRKVAPRESSAPRELIAPTDKDDAASLYALALEKIADTNDCSTKTPADAIATMLADEQTLRNWLRSHGHGIALDAGRSGIYMAIDLLSEAAGSFSLLSRSPHASYHAGPWSQRVARDPADHDKIESLCRHGVIPYPWGCAQSFLHISNPDIYMPLGAFRDGGTR